MRLETQDSFRVAYLVMAGLLLTGASTAWNTGGYLSISAWIMEWTDIILSFYFLIASLMDSNPICIKTGYVLMVVSSIMVLFSISFVNLHSMSDAAPYLPNSIFYIIFAVPIAATLSVFLLSDRRHNFKQVSAIFFISFSASMMILTYTFFLAGPRLPTDETVLNLYAGHLFLKGMDPYNPTLTLQAFPFYHFPYYYDTPLTNGGYVSTLSYPALSFITFLPAVILNLKPTIVMLPFFIVPIILVWYRAWALKEWALSIFILVPFLSFILYAPQVEFGDLNIVWASLLMASYFFLSRIKTSGALFGLSLSVKQFPAIIFPFLLYYIFRTQGFKKALIWIITAVLVFLLINGYFMLTDLHFFIHNMLQDEFSPLIGVGMGVSQLSFLDFIDVPRLYFTIAIIVTFLTLVAVYVIFFDKLKYAFFAFPILIFFFNYRLFIQYLEYWLIISILPAVDLINKRHERIEDRHLFVSRLVKGKKNRKQVRIFATFFVILIAVAMIVGYQQGSSQNTGHFDITSLEFLKYNSTGFAEEAVVNITYNGGIINQTPVLFRFVIPGEITNVNTNLWRPAQNITLQSGCPAEVIIIPLYSAYSIPGNSPYRLIAYYGPIQGAYSHNISL